MRAHGSGISRESFEKKMEETGAPVSIPEVTTTPTSEDLVPVAADLSKAPQVNGVSSPAEKNANQERENGPECEGRVDELVVQAETCTGGVADSADDGTSTIQTMSAASPTPDGAQSSTMAEGEDITVDIKESSDTATTAASNQQAGVSIRAITPSIYYSDEEGEEQKAVVEQKAPKRMTRVRLVSQ